jgi:subtilisin
MSTSLIESELAASGVAQVIVVLKSPTPSMASGGTALAAAAGTATSSSSLAQYFRSSELSINSQIAAAGMKKAGQLSASASLSAARPSPPPPVRYYPNLGVALGTVDRAGLAGLEADPNVATVTGAPQISPIWPEKIAAAKAPKELTWGLQALRVDALWKAGLTGKGIRVGQLDTGIDGTHPTLKSSLHKFAEFDLFGEIRKPSPSAYDTDDHGTHTAATIAGRGVGNRHVGVAPEAQLVGAIVIEGGNAIARVLGGIDWAHGLGMRVLSLSLGFRGWWDNFVPIMAVLRARNVLPIIAVGNEGAGISRSPGNYPNVLSVGAMDEKGRIPNFSCSQGFARVDRPDVPYLVAPGVDIISAKPGGGYQSMDGTSMATPHIAGLAALLFQAKPGATADEVEQAILGSCRLWPTMSATRAGAGCPDAVEALRLLTGTKLDAKPAAKSITTKKTSKPKPPAQRGSKKGSSAKRATAKKAGGKKRPAKRIAAKRPRRKSD